MLKELMWLFKNPDIINKYNYLKKNNKTLKENNNQLKDERRPLILRLNKLINMVKQKDYYKRKYNQLDSTLQEIKEVNNLKGNINIAYEIKNRLNMYKETYYSKNPTLNDIDNNYENNHNTSDNDISNYEFEFSIQNPMYYSPFTLKHLNRINTTTHLLRGYLRRLRTKNYDKFKKLLFNTPKYPSDIFYHYINIVKKKNKN